MSKKRLDEILMERGLATTKESALKMILGGAVLAHGQKAISPSQRYAETIDIEIRGASQYVGRGGEKLAYAIKKFAINPAGKICLDIGSAIGGFVDVLLQNGAKKVYAVDTAKGKLDVKLRGDPRVVVMEETNILNLQSLPEPVDIITIDVSLTSLRNVFPHLKKFLQPRGIGVHHPTGEVVALFKPQYEVTGKQFLKHGILEDAAVRKQTLDDFLAWLPHNGWKLLAQTTSPIKGSEGNTEFLLYIQSQ